MRNKVALPEEVLWKQDEEKLILYGGGNIANALQQVSVYIITNLIAL